MAEKRGGADMKIGDIVKPVHFPGARAGIVRSVDGREVAVRWVLGSGWNHTAVYDLDELEKEVKR